MDTKKLFIKTQTNLINWAIAISLILTFLILYAFFRNPYSFSSIATVTLYTLISALLIRAKLKLELKTALLPPLLFIPLSFLGKLPTIPFFEEVLGFLSHIYPSYWLVTCCMFSISCTYLYYKAYKAVSIIKKINVETASAV